MKTNIKLKDGEILIIDPCYIVEVFDTSHTRRYDALKLVKEKNTNGDGIFDLRSNPENDIIKSLSVDSGRIWALQAEFTCDIIVAVDQDDFYITSNIINLKNIKIKI